MAKARHGLPLVLHGLERNLREGSRYGSERSIGETFGNNMQLLWNTPPCFGCPREQLRSWQTELVGASTSYKKPNPAVTTQPVLLGLVAWCPVKATVTTDILDMSAALASIIYFKQKIHQHSRLWLKSPIVAQLGNKTHSREQDELQAISLTSPKDMNP